MSRQPIGVWLPLHARIVAVGSTAVRGKADIPKVPPARKAQWIRVADPRRAEIHLRDNSRNAIDWLESCFSHDGLRSLRQRPLLQCYATADAMAQGDTVGIGGWIVTANSIAWFSEQYHMARYAPYGQHCMTPRKNTSHVLRHWHSWPWPCWPTAHVQRGAGLLRCPQHRTTRPQKPVWISCGAPPSHWAPS